MENNRNLENLIMSFHLLFHPFEIVIKEGCFFVTGRLARIRGVL
jgi:hypothetical protein